MLQPANESLANYIRIYRRNAGLTQAELGRMLGYRDETAVAKHEHFDSMPPFLTAIGYEVIFQAPVSRLFAGMKEAVAIGIEDRLAEFERRLRDRNDQPPSQETEKTLAWLEGRGASRVLPEFLAS